MKIAIAVSQFNAEICEKLLQGAIARLLERGVDRDHIEIIHVPGACELPLMAQQFAQTKMYDAIICLGAVIRGETDHYDYVAEQASDGCLRVGLKYNIPVLFGVLTTQNIELAKDRVGGKRGHKGKEVADAAIDMMQAINKLKTRGATTLVNA